MAPKEWSSSAYREPRTGTLRSKATGFTTTECMESGAVAIATFLVQGNRIARNGAPNRFLSQSGMTMDGAGIDLSFNSNSANNNVVIEHNEIQANYREGVRIWGILTERISFNNILDHSWGAITYWDSPLPKFLAGPRPSIGAISAGSNYYGGETDEHGRPPINTYVVEWAPVAEQAQVVH